MNKDQLLHYAQSEEILHSYLLQRLSLTEEQEYAVCAHYQADEHKEDIIFTLYHYLNDEQKSWFWNALSSLSKTAWASENSILFKSTVFLYCRLGFSAAQTFKWQAFFTKEEITWHPPVTQKRLDMNYYALLLMSRWEWLPKSEIILFCQNQLHTLIPQAGQNKSLMSVITLIINYIEFLDQKSWNLLITYFIKDQQLSEKLNYYIMTSFYFCDDASEKQQELIAKLNSALAIARANNLLNHVEKILTPLKELGWKIKTAVEDLDNKNSKNNPKKTPPWSQLKMAA